MRELFRQNAHGDIWQEPELFDQPDVEDADLYHAPMRSDGDWEDYGGEVDGFGNVYSDADPGL